MFDSYKIYYGRKCDKCCNDIVVDDIDYNFKGNQDEYLFCEHCKQSIFVKVRYGLVIKVERFDYDK